MGLRIDVLTPADWDLLRTVRLAALRESPHAFLSSYDAELRWDEDGWRRALGSARWVVVRHAAVPVGLACSSADGVPPGARHLEGVWVSPAHRRMGVTRAIVDFVRDVEGQAGVTELLVWVLQGNAEARKVYERLGFRATGERAWPAAAQGRYEERLKLEITPD